MPTYEYTCTDCGHHLEVSQSFSDEPLTSCPNCGGRLRKVFGSIGIVLKGSGFYRTDSRAASNGKAVAKDKDKSDKSKADKAEKADTKGGTSSGSGSEPAAPSPSTTTSATPSASSGTGTSSKAAAAAG